MTIHTCKSRVPLLLLRYVSLSVNMLDCSWFNSCNELHTDVSGFRTSAVEPAMVAFGRTITPARDRPSSSSK